nr:MAG TPA: hypothetical protein [Caudoviricetes sp.]
MVRALFVRAIHNLWGDSMMERYAFARYGFL